MFPFLCSPKQHNKMQLGSMNTHRYQHIPVPFSCAAISFLVNYPARAAMVQVFSLTDYLLAEWELMEQRWSGHHTCLVEDCFPWWVLTGFTGLLAQFAHLLLDPSFRFLPLVSLRLLYRITWTGKQHNVKLRRLQSSSVVVLL